jgi:uncharacterized protein YggT (Ycf19 family)
MIFMANLFNLPFLILAWLIEFYLFLTALRLVISLNKSARQSQYYHQFKLLTDPLPKMISGCLAKRRKASTSSWVSWLIVISAACVLRQILVTMVVV